LGRGAEAKAYLARRPDQYLYAKTFFTKNYFNNNVKTGGLLGTNRTIF